MPKKGSTVSEETRQRMKEAWTKRDPHPQITGRYGLTEETIRAELAAGRIWCSDCKSFRDSDCFDKSKRKHRCKDCRSKRNKGDYQSRREYHLERRKTYYRRVLGSKEQKDRLFARHGTDYAWYERTLSEQRGGCAICGSEDSKGHGRYMFVDHDHRCCQPGRACDKCRRGLLCSLCNSALERIETDPQWGIKALAYLGRYACLN